MSPSTCLPGAAELFARHIESCEDCRLWNAAADFRAFYSHCFDLIRDCRRCFESDGEHTLQHLQSAHKKMFRLACLTGRQLYTEACGLLRSAGKGRLGVSPRLRQEIRVAEQARLRQDLAEAVGPAWLRMIRSLEDSRHQ